MKFKIPQLLAIPQPCKCIYCPNVTADWYKCFKCQWNGCEKCWKDHDHQGCRKSAKESGEFIETDSKPQAIKMDTANPTPSETAPFVKAVVPATVPVEVPPTYPDEDRDEDDEAYEDVSESEEVDEIEEAPVVEKKSGLIPANAMDTLRKKAGKAMTTFSEDAEVAALMTGSEQVVKLAKQPLANQLGKMAGSSAAAAGFAEFFNSAAGEGLVAYMAGLAFTLAPDDPRMAKFKKLGTFVRAQGIKKGTDLVAQVLVDPFIEALSNINIPGLTSDVEEEDEDEMVEAQALPEGNNSFSFEERPKEEVMVPRVNGTARAHAKHNH